MALATEHTGEESVPPHRHSRSTRNSLGTNCTMSIGVRSALAPTGVLRAGINLSNFLLVSSRAPDTGLPQGVAPDLAAALAKRLEVPLQLVPFEKPSLLAAAASADAWDVGLIGAEPQRAESICFSAPYCEIRATFMVPSGSERSSFTELDQPGMRIGVSEGSAYDLWLSRNLQHATLHRAPGLDASFELFVSEGLDALAGLRPKLLMDAEKLDGAIVLDEHFTSVQQAVGTPRSVADGGATLWIERFVAEAKASGLVAELIRRHGVEGKLSVAP